MLAVDKSRSHQRRRRLLSFQGVVMKLCNVPCCVALIVLGFISARAAVFGDVKGAVVDPQQRPIAAARVTLSSHSSAFARTLDTDNAGEFLFRAVAIGEYLIAVEAS